MEQNTKPKLFREKSFETIETPESMNDYLQVTSPGIWIILSAIIAILIGALLWGVLGRINTYVNVAVVSTANNSTCMVSYDKLSDVVSSGVVFIDDTEYALSLNDDIETMIISEDTNPLIRMAGNFQLGDVAVKIPIATHLPEGIHTGKVTTESLQPIKLLIQ